MTSPIYSLYNRIVLCVLQFFIFFIILNILVVVLFLNKAIQSFQPCNLLERLRYISMPITVIQRRHYRRCRIVSRKICMAPWALRGGGEGNVPLTPKPRKFSKQWEHPTTQPAMRINSRKNSNFR